MRTLSAESSNPFVVHDKEVDIVRFAINSGFADIVLDGQVALRVMYQRPGETEVRAKTLTYYDTDGLHNYYDWQLSQSDLAKNGSLMVALCILDISGGEVSEWHTTPCAVRVLSTIHTDDSDEGDDTITPTVKERVAVLETMIQRVASGAPIVVSSTSEMTDTEQIYVLSTNGRWYYHNGTTWVSGGTYGAVSTDTTLTQSGSPADAKVVGDEITTIKADLGDISEENRNMFSGEIGRTYGMTWGDGTLTNTSADERTQFYCILRFRNGDSNIVASTIKVISASARYDITLTPTSDGDNIQIVHNGSRTNLTATLFCNFEANKTYTVSFDVDGYNPSIVGGLDISKIQIELGDTATEYIDHTTAYDEVARADSTQALQKANAISVASPNLFDGTISSFSNMAENDGKIENTNTDTRESFYFTVRYLDGSTLKDTSPTRPINFAGRATQTLTATANCTAIQVMHNGRQRNMSFTVPFAISSGETYTVSLNVESYNVSAAGGLVLSDIQIESGYKGTAYIPNKYTAVDYVARDSINVSTPEARLNVLLMGDSIFGNDGEIALFLDQMCNSCVNGAFGGTRVSVRPYTSGDFRFFDGVNIITALCTQTWTDQDAGAESLVSSYPWITARLAGLKAVDMSKVDLLIMDWGTNDYTAGATIEDIITAYNTVIDLLQTTYPELRILITTPIWRYWGTEADNENGDTKVYNASTLKEIVLAIEDFMKNKRISVLNAYQNLPLSYKTALTYFDANDKTHLNTFGNKVYAYLLHGKIRSIY